MTEGHGPYALQGAIAEHHAVAASAAATDWSRIVERYGDLLRLSPNPVVELNRAIAVSMADRPAAGLAFVDELAARGALAGSYLPPSVRGELLSRLGRDEEAKTELTHAAELTANDRVRAALLAKATGYIRN